MKHLLFILVLIAHQTVGQDSIEPGSVLWKKEVESMPIITTSNSERIFVRTEGQLFALSEAEGSVVWRFTNGLSGVKNYESPIATPAGDAICIGPKKTHLLNGTNGTVIWVQDYRILAPITFGENDTLYTVIQEGGQNSKYCEIDLKTGVARQLSTLYSYRQTASGPSGTSFEHSPNGLRCFDLKTGTNIWFQPNLDGMIIGKSIAVNEDTVIILTGSSSLFAFDCATGRKKWEALNVGIPNSDSREKLLMLPNDTCVFTAVLRLKSSGKQGLCAIDAKTGVTKWNLLPEDQASVMPLAIGSDFEIYTPHMVVDGLTGVIKRKNNYQPKIESRFSITSSGLTKSGKLVIGLGTEKSIVCVKVENLGRANSENSYPDQTTPKFNQYVKKIQGTAKVQVISIKKSETALLEFESDTKEGLVFQWYKSGRPILNKTNATLEINNASTGDEGLYRLFCLSEDGRGFFTDFSLKVSVGFPTIVKSPVGGIFQNGQGNVELSVFAEGGGLSCQWMLNGKALKGETNLSMNFQRIRHNDSGEYSVSIKNQYGEVISNAATVIVPLVTSATIWEKIKTNPMVPDLRPSVDRKGRVFYIDDYNYRISSIDSKTGSVNWERWFGNMTQAPTISPDGFVFINSEPYTYGINEARLSALNSETGEVLWSLAVKNNANTSGIISPPIIGGNGEIYFSHHSKTQPRITSVDWKRNQTNWVAQNIPGRPIALGADGVLYVSDGMTLTALDSKTGLKIWLLSSLNRITSIDLKTIMIAPSGFLYLTANYLGQNSLIEVETIRGIRNGSLWYEPVIKKVRDSTFTPACIAMDNVLYGNVFYNNAKKISQINLAAGYTYSVFSDLSERLQGNFWKPNFVCEVRSDNVVYARISPGKLFAVDRGTGMILWEKNFGSSPYDSSMSISEDGTMLLETAGTTAGTKHVLHAVSVSPMGSRGSSWTHSRKDASSNPYIAYILQRGIEDKNLEAGSALRFEPLVNSSLPLKYRWSKDGEYILNATNQTFFINKISVTDSGCYSLEICDAFGVIAVLRASVTIANAPPRQIWSYYSLGSVDAAPALSTAGTLYVGSADSSLHALNSDDGSQKWKIHREGMINPLAVSGEGGFVYFSTGGGVCAASEETGLVLWEYNFERNIFWDMTPAISGGIVYALDGFNLIALDISTGREVWRSNCKTFGTSPAISADGTVYVNGSEGLQAFDGNTGLEKWRALGSNLTASSPAIDKDGIVYSVENFKVIRAINGATGKVYWRFFNQNKGEFYSSPVLGDNGDVYIGGSDSNFYAIDGLTGKLKWQYPAIGEIFSTAAIGNTGEVYFGCYSGYIYAINCASGNELWKMATSSSIVSSPVLGPNGRIYFGSRNGQVYCVQTGSSGPGLSSWPMSGRWFTRDSHAEKSRAQLVIKDVVDGGSSLRVEIRAAVGAPLVFEESLDLNNWSVIGNDVGGGWAGKTVDLKFSTILSSRFVRVREMQ